MDQNASNILVAKTTQIENIQIQPEHISNIRKNFFEAKTIDQLIAEQGTKPITDWDSFSGAFPDEGLDEMLSEIYADRDAQNN